jgi:hypothetical protein
MNTLALGPLPNSPAHQTLNRVLLEVLGTQEQVHYWWYQKNLQFQNRLPIECNLKEVYTYIMSFYGR